MIRLVLRLDDPSATSNQAIEAAILDALARHGLCATFAVIPYRGPAGDLVPMTSARAGAMRDALQGGVLDVALHGHSHTNVAVAGKPSEFIGVPLAQQHQQLAAGRALLEDVFERRIGGFVPPWNSFDAATLEALETLGFDHLSANVGHAPMRPTPLRLLPLTCHLADFKQAVAEARRFIRWQPVIVVVMHHYDFPGGDAPVFRETAEFDAWLAWIAAQTDIEVTTLSRLAASLSPAASQRVFQLHRLRDRLPWRFRGHFPGLCAPTRLWPKLIAPTDL